MLPVSGVESKLPWEKQLCHHFSIHEILIATRNFDEELVIGKGGFGKVYKGAITYAEDGRTHVAAIKRLESESRQGAPEFWTEIKMLSKFRHCHLVSLIGYCNDKGEMILVYEYMPNGSLFDHLHKAATQLSWMQRLEICVGAARGLDYLHTGTSTHEGVIHRDVKSPNILLDENWAAKISDFGLSKIGPINQSSTHVNTAVKGTPGYLDPEYKKTSSVSRGSDVYGFGVVLFEVLSGMRAFDDNRDKEQRDLAIWAQECIRKGKLDQIIDSNLRGQVSPKCLKKFTKIAGQCLNSDPKQRPRMQEVAFFLKAAMESQLDISIGSMSFSKKMQKLFSSSSTGNSVKSAKDIGGNVIDFPLGKHKKYRDLKIFSFDELERATSNFTPENFLGRGNYGQVFKGWVNKKTYAPSEIGVGMAVAVKMLDTKRFQGLREKQAVQSALELLRGYSHPNIVHLLGYCLENEKVVLVYEYIKNGSFYSHLIKEGAKALPWVTRLKVVVGAARGLSFLHTVETSGTYRKLKMHNILLDEELNPKLSDVGLENFHAAGAVDYAIKRDVFGFGKVLLETLTGRDYGGSDMLERTMPLLCDGKEILKLVDPRLKQKYPQQGAILLGALALRCFQPANDRLSMHEVLQMLEQVSTLKDGTE